MLDQGGETKNKEKLLVHEKTLMSDVNFDLLFRINIYSIIRINSIF